MRRLLTGSLILGLVAVLALGLVSAAIASSGHKGGDGITIASSKTRLKPDHRFTLSGTIAGKPPKNGEVGIFRREHGSWKLLRKVQLDHRSYATTLSSEPGTWVLRAAYSITTGKTTELVKSSTIDVRVHGRDHTDLGKDHH